MPSKTKKDKSLKRYKNFLSNQNTLRALKAKMLVSKVKKNSTLAFHVFETKNTLVQL